jgi:hypothetical protein
MTIRPRLKGLQAGAMERVQLQHPGWRMPPHTRKVDRSTGRAPDGWGNPFDSGTCAERATAFAIWAWAPAQADFRSKVRRELRGLNLACWCPLDGPCHADTLLAIANGSDEHQRDRHALTVPG